MIRLLAAALLGGPLVAGLAGVGVPWPAGLAVVALVAGAFLWPERKRVTALRVSPAGLAFLLLLVVAAASLARLSVFMLDARRSDLSVLPERQFFVTHNCLTSYTEAATLAPAGVNVFDPLRYGDAGSTLEQWRPRYIGPFEIDLYQYPPPFLALPRAAVAAELEFSRIRRLWYALQAVLLFAAMVVLSR